MALKGDLASVGLADVFQMLAHNQKVGLLSIHGRESWKALYFDRRGVTLYYNEHTFLDRLLDAMARRNYVTTDLLDSLRRQCAGDPITTVEALLSGGLVQESIFLESFRTQMEEEIYDLFLWEKVHWEFLEGQKVVEGREGVVNENFFFPADSLIMEAARRLDEWVFIRELVASPAEVFEAISSYSAEEVALLEEHELSVFDLIDGKRNVARITEVAQLTSFQVHKSISVLAQKGFVQALPDEKLVENANECIQGARLEDGIRLLERAIQVGAGLPDAHLLAARSYEMLDEVASATWHYKSYSNFQVEAGQVDEAVQCMQHALSLVPTDLEAWESLLQSLMAQQTPALDPHQVGKDLTDLYLELDEVERARDVLEDLLKARPEDVELKKTLITVHTKAGDTKRVMELYESIADDLVAAKDPIGAVRYLQKILMIDRNRREISDRIKQLYVLDERHRSRRRSVALILASVLCFGTLGTVYYFYEKNVRTEFAKLDAEPFLAEKDFDGAIRMYETFLARYPLSFVDADVESEIARIQGLASIEESKRKAIATEKAAIARKRRNEYIKIWREYERAVDDQIDMAKALRQLEDVQRLAIAAAEPRDRDFLNKNQIEKTIRTTRDYLAKSQSLLADVNKAWNDGGYEEARKGALALHRDYPFTPASKSCAVPLLVRSVPAGANIVVGGELWTDRDGRPAKTPTYLRLPYQTKTSVRLERDGFETAAFKLEGKSSSPWTVTLSVRPERIFGVEGDPVTGIAIGPKSAFVGLRGGRFTALDPRDGKASWTMRLEGLDEVRNTPIIAGSRVLLGTTLGRVQAIESTTGETLWNREVPGGFSGNITVTENGVVVGNNSGELVLLDAGSGRPLWRFDTEARIRLDPLWDGTWLYYANADGLLLCLDTNEAETPLWSRTDLPGALATPIRAGKQLVILSRDGKVHGYEDRRGGRELWSIESGVSTERAWLMPHGGTGFIVVGADGRMRRLDPKHPDTQVRAERNLGRKVLQKPLRTQASIFLVTRGDASDVQIVSLNPEDLSLRWDFVLRGGIAGDATILGDAVLVVGADGKVRVLR